MPALEICVDSVESATAAEAGGADRVELCSALSEGGLTPSLGLLRAVRSRISIGVHVMIRPRAGRFVYSNEEIAVMREDILIAAQAGADGVVLGVLTESDEVDIERTRALVELARPMEVTFHRAIDVGSDLVSALEKVILTGAERVLTSGGEPNAVAGRHMIGKLMRASEGRIRVMVGGGVRPQNLVEIARESGAMEYHATLRDTAPAPDETRRVNPGNSHVDSYSKSVVRVADVQKLRQALQAAVPSFADPPAAK